ncbi:MAG TPA: LLM class F420-dependent oxidoreductase [Acidimicrobiales bacterium]|nr:LLM class F420-dependent oxidoreductase [Acidimicrobiales bacterium]
MRLGVVFPQYEIGSDPGAIRDYAQTAEGLGFSHLLAYDHVLGADGSDRPVPLGGPYTERHAFHEPLALFSYLSGLTERIGFATGVLVLPQRQTALVAKQAAEVAILSAGRFRLGVGVGWNRIEYEALGADLATRGRRLDDQVAVLRRLWTEPVVDLESPWHRIDRAGIAPRPSVPVPIWMGGFSEPAFERAARLGDGFLFSRRGGRRPGEGSTEPLAGVVEQVGRLRRRVADLGRDPETFGIECRINYTSGPDTWRDELAQLAVAAVDLVAINPLDAGLGSAEAHIGALHRIAEECRTAGVGVGRS